MRLILGRTLFLKTRMKYAAIEVSRRWEGEDIVEEEFAGESGRLYSNLEDTNCFFFSRRGMIVTDGIILDGFGGSTLVDVGKGAR